MIISADTAPVDPDAGAEPLVVFVHIRKTAGTTVRDLIVRQYERRIRMVRNYFVEPDRSFEMARWLATEPPQDVRAIHGHMLFWPDLPWPRDTRFFTFLRDPVERTISHFAWLRVRSPKFTKSLEEALADGSIHDNLQTRVVAGSMPFVATEETLTRALANLQHLDVVGLTERFDESVVLLTRTLGWRPSIYKTRNVTSDRPRQQELPRETLQAVKRYNALDLELYRHARERFDRVVAAQGDEFTIDVAALQRATQCLAEAPEDADRARLIPSGRRSSLRGPAALREQLTEARAGLLLRDAELDRLRLRTAHASADAGGAAAPTEAETREEALAAAQERERRRLRKAERKMQLLVDAGTSPDSADVEELRREIANAQSRMQSIERRKAKLGRRAEPPVKNAR